MSKILKLAKGNPNADVGFCGFCGKEANVAGIVMEDSEDFFEKDIGICKECVVKEYEKIRENHHVCCGKEMDVCALDQGNGWRCKNCGRTSYDEASCDDKIWVRKENK